MTETLEDIVRVFPVQIPPGFVPHAGGPTVPQGSRRCDLPPYTPTLGAGVDAMRGAHRHDAVDIGAAYGAPVVSTCDGEVFEEWVYRGHPRPGAGSLDEVAGYVRVRGPGNVVVYYAHLRPVRVSPGDRVTTGQCLGYVYHAGSRGGPAHLHYQIRSADRRGSAAGSRRLDPMPRLRQLLAAGGWVGLSAIPLLRP
jgi:murein DD-endopeptidase MepM/ murein hydrolase activator NlpD